MIRILGTVKYHSQKKDVLEMATLVVTSNSSDLPCHEASLRMMKGRRGNVFDQGFFGFLSRKKERKGEEVLARMTDGRVSGSDPITGFSCQIYLDGEHAL